MSFSERIYRLLLRAYPGAYHSRYAGPMEQLFRDRLRRADSFPELAQLWARTLADWVVSVPARHWERVLPRHASILSDPSRRCLFFARSEASSFSRREITVEHLLLGILREKGSLVPESALDPIVRAIEANEHQGRRVPPMEELRLSEAAIRTVKAARQIAQRAGRQQVAPADLAAGILREADTLAAHLLREHMRLP